jgi:hypothetical protein
VPTMASFSTDKKLIAFARKFFRDRVGSFRKDVRICLTADNKRDHAYFPALITCIAFLDFLSGLYSGKLEGHGHTELQQYVARFMNRTNYDPLRVTALYTIFRHKIAHLSVPYVVFDTRNRKEFAAYKQRRITWSVYAGKRPLPIELRDYPTPQPLKRTLRPWPLDFDCRALVSVRRFEIDIVKSIYGRSGYLNNLRADAKAKAHFTKCMNTLFPR